MSEDTNRNIVCDSEAEGWEQEEVVAGNTLRSVNF